MTGARIVAAVLALVLVIGGVAAALVGGSPRAETPVTVPAAGAGSAMVVLSTDAARHPNGEPVRAQLQRYFDAINAGDYAAWVGAVVEQRSQEQSEEAWKTAFRSTVDGTIRVDRIDGGGAGGPLLVRVRFVSTQDVADAPADAQAPRLCWRSTLPMEGSPPRIAVTRGGSSTKEIC